MAWVPLTSFSPHVLQTSGEDSLESGARGSSPQVQHRLKCQGEEGHLAMTYAALAILVTLGDSLERVNAKAIVQAIRSLQQEDGRCASMFGAMEGTSEMLSCLEMTVGTSTSCPPLDCSFSDTWAVYWALRVVLNIFPASTGVIDEVYSCRWAGHGRAIATCMVLASLRSCQLSIQGVTYLNLSEHIVRLHHLDACAHLVASLRHERSMSTDKLPKLGSSIVGLITPCMLWIWLCD